MNNKLRAVIVDDEPHALTLFKKVIEWYADQIEIVGEANNLPKAIQIITETKPNVVFLDIEMPNYSGLQINDFFEYPRDFEIVFITAHNDYSIKAIRIKAFDYLLKPLNALELKECLDRLQILQNTTKQLQPNIEENEDLKKDLISINSKKGIFYLNKYQIIFIQASAMYSIIITEQEEHVVSRPLKDFEFLTQDFFFRNHRSYIVNCHFVKRISNQNGSEVELMNGQILPLARNRIDSFKLFMKENFTSDFNCILNKKSLI